MPEPNWPAIQLAWEAGKPDKAIASAHKIEAGRINRRASRYRWNKANRPKPPKTARTRNAKSTKASNAVAEALPDLSAVVSIDLALEVDAYLSQHRDDWQGLRAVAIKCLTATAMADDPDPKLLTAITGALKAVQDGQRKSLGISDKSGDGHPDGEGLGAIVIPVKTIEDGDDAINEAIGITPIIPSDG